MGNQGRELGKRLFDLTLATFSIGVAGPFLALIALLIKLEDRGPVLFRQTRVGRNGHPFEMLKFRTMVIDAGHQRAELHGSNERESPLFKIADDPRSTRVGRLLRESNLDELPQLFNVLTGAMSMVGPRPALPAEVEQFSARVRQRERVKPGITGLWQLRAGIDPSFESYQRLDLFYVENWSLKMDTYIFAATITQLVVFLARRVGTTQAVSGRHLPWGCADGGEGMAGGADR